MFGFGKRKELEELDARLTRQHYRIIDAEDSLRLILQLRRRIEELEARQVALFTHFGLTIRTVPDHVELVEKDTH